MNASQLAADLQTALTDFQEVLKTIPNDALNTPPHPGSWTPGQVARHLAISNSGFLDLVNGPTRPTTDRPYDAMVENLKVTLLDFTTKMQAPVFVVPPAIAYDRERLLASFEKVKTGLPAVFAHLDLTLTCTAFELPRTGYLTRMEALHFMLFHTLRHLHQLRNTAAALREAKTG